MFEEEMMRITFANTYTSPGGRVYKGGTTAEVNDADARSLIVRGKARRAGASLRQITSTDDGPEPEQGDPE
jgi:hypothetical protein